MRAFIGLGLLLVCLAPLGCGAKRDAATANASKSAAPSEFGAAGSMTVGSAPSEGPAMAEPTFAPAEGPVGSGEYAVEMSADEAEATQAAEPPSAGSYSAAALPSAGSYSAAARKSQAYSAAPSFSVPEWTIPDAPSPEAHGAPELPAAAAPTEDIPLAPSSTSASTGPADLDRAPFKVVEVFYATDRRRIDPAAPSWIHVAANFRGTLIAAGVLLLSLGWLVKAERRLAPATLALVGVGAAIWLGHPAAVRTLKEFRAAAAGNPQYTNERGAFELGTCEVSVPLRHEVGELEAPTIMRLEVSESADRHVMLVSVRPQDADSFYSRVQSRVAQSPGREALVFVHGYNVTFENAVRRTAQIAHDLKFPGAPILYSWPSQGGLLQYTLDENNAAWTTPHLREFLIDVAKRSGATSINLVAHSMGSRAMTQALTDISREHRDQPPLFHQLVLAAPDIDAEIFRRDLAPALTRAAGRVTLYASSDDQALAASRTVHGYSRAGESGEGLVVTPGIDTIDVSGIDTSLLGHSYYGTSQSILYDLYDVVHFSMPPAQRRLLRPGVRDGLTYWILKDETAVGVAPAAPLR